MEDLAVTVLVAGIGVVILLVGGFFLLGLWNSGGHGSGRGDKVSASDAFSLLLFGGLGVTIGGSVVAFAVWPYIFKTPEPVAPPAITIEQLEGVWLAVGPSETPREQRFDLIHFLDDGTFHCECFDSKPNSGQPARLAYGGFTTRFKPGLYETSVRRDRNKNTYEDWIDLGGKSHEIWFEPQEFTLLYEDLTDIDRIRRDSARRRGEENPPINYNKILFEKVTNKQASAVLWDLQRGLRPDSFTAVDSNENKRFQLLNRIIALTPQDTEALLIRSMIFAKRGKPAQAETDIQAAMEIAKTNKIETAREIYLTAAQYKIDRNDFKNAISILDEALSLPPGSALLNAEIFAERGLCHQSLGDYEQALKDYDAAIQAENTFHVALFRRAWLRATSLEKKVRDGNAAVADAEMALESAGGKSTAYDRSVIAAAYAEAGDFASAGKWIALAIELQPENARLQSMKATFDNQQPWRIKR